MIRESIVRILKEYSKATGQAFSKHPLAKFIREDFPKEFLPFIDNPDQYLVEGSPGQGNWARCPWLAIFDRLITNSAHSGYYPVYLFREDLSGVYLSLNQGVTVFKENYKSATKDALKAKASDFLSQIGGLPARFPLGIIDLKPATPSSLSSYYEAGNICARLYEASSLPSEAELVADLKAILRIYETLSYNENTPTNPGEREADEDPNAKFEELRRIRHHKRIERNQSLAKKAKEYHGFVCKACGFNFESHYRELGAGYIEAHHLQPLAKLKEEKILLSPKDDFTVLCSNCHRMIHRFDDTSAIDRFVKTILK